MGEPEAIGDILEDNNLGNLENKPSQEDTEKKQWGGPRPGGGRPRGKMNRKTLEAMKVKEQVNQRIMQNADKLISAQLDLAVGEKVLMVVITEGEGKNRRRYTELVTDPDIIKDYIDYNEGIDGADSPDDDSHYYYMTTKPANNQAIDSLVNRALGKVPDKIEVEGGFFRQPELTIKVVGPQHDELVISDDGQVAGEEDRGDNSGADPVGTPEPSDTAS